MSSLPNVRLSLIIIIPKGTLYHNVCYEHEQIPPCNARRKEKVGALFNIVFGLLAIINKAYP